MSSNDLVTAEVRDLMKVLAMRRPVFHSEADFQHALAWALHERHSNASVRLEYRPPDFGRRYIDIWFQEKTRTLAIELKYWTRRLDRTVGEEKFSLLDQGAQDIGRYDFLKDVQRLEEVVGLSPGCIGIAIALTNDSNYWSPPRRSTTVDSAFRLHDGRIAQGRVEWAAHTGKGTSQGREAAITLSGAHTMLWQDYSRIEGDGHTRLCYLLVAVSNDHARKHS